MGERHSDNQPEASTDESARRLGVSRDAVYKRVRRGSIPSETGEDGFLHVYIYTSIDAATEGSTDASSPHLERLLQNQEREIEYLRGQLEEANTRDRENRRIIASLTQRIQELEAPPRTPQEAQGVAENASKGEGRESGRGG